jgi:hypothetical protein
MFHRPSLILSCARFLLFVAFQVEAPEIVRDHRSRPSALLSSHARMCANVCGCVRACLHRVEGRDWRWYVQVASSSAIAGECDAALALSLQSDFAHSCSVVCSSRRSLRRALRLLLEILVSSLRNSAVFANPSILQCSNSIRLTFSIRSRSASAPKRTR